MKLVKLIGLSSLRKFRTAEHFRAIGSSMTSFQLTILLFPDNPATLKLSLLFFLSSLLSNFSYLNTCKKIRSFLNKCLALVKMRPLRQISLDLQGSRPFLRPQLGSQPCQAREPWWGWGSKGAWRGRYFNCPVFKYMPPFFFVALFNPSCSPRTREYS